MSEKDRLTKLALKQHKRYSDAQNTLDKLLGGAHTPTMAARLSEWVDEQKEALNKIHRKLADQ